MKKASSRSIFLHLAFIFLLVIAVVITYWRITTIYFQQDEWVGFGQIVTQDLWSVIKGYSLTDVIVSKDRLIATPVNYFLFNLSPFSPTPYAVFAITMHTINTILVYIIVFREAQSKVAAFIGAALFGITSVSHQAITWFAAVTTTLSSGTAFLLSILFFLEFLRTRSKIHLYGMQIFAILSFFFKESSLFLIVFLPLFAILHSKKISILRTFWLLFFYNGLVALMRINHFFSPVGKTGEFVSQDSTVISKLISHIIYYPLLSVSQFFIPSNILFKIASFYQSVNYTFLQNQQLSQSIAENIVTDTLSLFFSGVIVLSSIFILKEKKTRLLSTSGLCLMLLSALPYIVLDRGSSYLESRYYYSGMVGAAFLLSSWVTFFFIRIHLRTYLLKILVVAVVVFVFYKYYSFTQRELDRQVIVAKERRNILAKVKEFYPILPKKVIFYFTGNRLSYYGIFGLPIPFQMGPGFTFMIWYYNTGTIPKELIVENFLTDLRSQAYKEIGDLGFGYFHNFEKLQRAIEYTNGLTKENVISFYYDSEKKQLEDITYEVRKTLSQ